MAPIDLIELDPARHLERDITNEDGRTPVSGPDPAAPQAADLAPPACPRCDTQHRELLGQPFSNAPLHRRAK